MFYTELDKQGKQLFALKAIDSNKKEFTCFVIGKNEIDAIRIFCDQFSGTKNLSELHIFKPYIIEWIICYQLV